MLTVPMCRCQEGSAAGSDGDFEADSEADSDDEETIAEQEGAERQQDHAMEISQLEVMWRLFEREVGGGAGT